MDIILEHPGLNSLVTILNNQWEMFVRARDSRDISMMRFSLNAAAGTQEMIQNRVGREEMIRLSLDWNAREELAALDAPSRPQNIPMPNQGLHPAHHMAGSLPVLNNNNAGMPPHPLRHTPASGYWMNQSMHPCKLHRALRPSTISNRSRWTSATNINAIIPETATQPTSSNP
ncbi:hypothetical protein PSTG_18880, partial [Puccinia striiformis f. sp. tritici PST-78]